MFHKSLAAATLLAAFAVPGVAAAATAVATTNVNLRAGPSTAYPAVNVVGSGNSVRVHGCLNGRSWCDVSYAGQRGWMSSNYLAYVTGGTRYTGVRAVQAAPIVTFSVGRYWDQNYRGRSFYRDRDRWDRRDIREERRDVRDARRDVRDARRDLREDLRDGRNPRDARRDLREERRELRDARRDLRRQYVD